MGKRGRLVRWSDEAAGNKRRGSDIPRHKPAVTVVKLRNGDISVAGDPAVVAWVWSQWMAAKRG